MRRAVRHGCVARRRGRDCSARRPARRRRRARRGRSARSRAAAPRRFRRSSLSSMPSETSSCRATRTPSPSNGRERRPRRPQRVVDDGHTRGEYACAELVLEEARLARDCGAADRPGEMAEQAGGDARVEEHGIFAGPGPRGLAAQLRAPQPCGRSQRRCRGRQDAAHCATRDPAASSRLRRQSPPQKRRGRWCDTRRKSRPRSPARWSTPTRLPRRRWNW